MCFRCGEVMPFSAEPRQRTRTGQHLLVRDPVPRSHRLDVAVRQAITDELAEFASEGHGPQLKAVHKFWSSRRQREADTGEDGARHPSENP